MTDYAIDHFTGTNWQYLTAHPPDKGGPIVKHPSAGGDWYIVDNRALCRSAGLMYYSATPASADYTVEADVRVFSSIGATGVAGRINTGSSNFYYLYLKQGNGELVLAKMVNGVATNLDSYFDSFSSGTTYTIGLQMAGTTLTGYLNGVAVIPTGAAINDSSHTAAGKGGIRAPQISDVGTGKHIDTFRVFDASSPPSGAAAARTRIVI